MKKTIICVITVVGLIAVFGVTLYLQGYVRFNYPDKSAFPIRGIDISHHQGQIDWNKLQQEDIAFVYIKATEGGDFQDPEFTNNWNNLRKMGLNYGAYHFFTFCKSGKEQAANFIQHVPQIPLTLPPVIDFEYVGNCQARPQKDKLLKELQNYIMAIESSYNKKPIFYTTYKAYEDYLQGRIDDYQVWIRDIWGSPGFTDGRSWIFWQYADRGRIQGIKGPVDLNVFNGSMDDFRKFIHSQARINQN